MLMRAHLGLFLGLALASPALAQTSIPAGNLVGSQTWTVAGSPYVLGGDVTVPAGITLSIQPGVQVRMGPGDTSGSGLDNARTELRVAGTLAVAGTAAMPVVITSGAATPATGNYYGVVLLAGATANLTSLTMQYAQRAVYAQATGVVINDLRTTNANVGVEVNAGSTNLSNSSITLSTSYGVYVSGGALTGSGLTIAQNASYGVYCVTAACSITNSLVRNNTSRGLYFRTDSGTYTQSVTHSTIVSNGTYGVYVTEVGGTQSSTVRDNIIISNGTYGVYVSGAPTMTVSNNLTFGQTTPYNAVSAGAGAIDEEPLLVNPAGQDFRPTSRSGARNGASDGMDIGAFAYDGAITPALVGHLFQNTTLTAAASPHLVTGDLTVEPGITLTIEPGAELRFASGADLMGAGVDTARTELRVRGTLVADGTTTLGIRFVSANATPAAGDWYGIELMAGASASVIDFATITHARYGIHSSASAGTVVQRSLIERCASYGVYADAGSLELSQMVVRNNGSYGMYFVGAGGTIQQSRIYDNVSRGLYLRTDSGTHTVQVLHNTIVGNGTYGVYITEVGGTQAVTVRDNIIVSNGTYGVYVSGAPSMTVSHNLVWGQATPYNAVSAGTGAISENPLMVDVTARDLRITTNSAARNHASDGSDIGALPHDGALTVGVHGHLYDSTTWSGTVDVLGDVTVEPGVTLTILPGTTVRFAANADSMAANTDVADSELLVRGRLVADGTPQSRITFTSASATPATADWYGIELTSSAANSTIDNAVIEWTRYGVYSQAPSTTSVTQSELRRAASYGVYVDGGAIALQGLWIHHNSSYGIYVVGASPTLTNLLINANVSRGLYYRTDSGTHTVIANHLTVYGNGTYGIYVTEVGGTQNFTLRNSIISDNGTYGVYVSGAPTMSLANNDVWGQTTPYNAVSAGPNSISANPQFVNPGLDNFHLLPNSPAIDAAAAATAAADDLEGNTRPVDGDMNGSNLPDLGAYEFNPSGNRWPVADAGADRVVTSGTPATFSGAGSFDPDGTVVSWVWDFGDGTPSASGQTVMHTFSGGTDRVVTLTVTDNAGAIDVDVVNVEVNLPPVANAGSDRFADPGEIVTFSATGSSDSDGTIATYAWSFGDGAQATGTTVMHAYATGGAYTVTLTVTDDDGATAVDTAIANITGGDGAPPIIVHTPIAAGRPVGQPVLVSATITDSSGVASANLYYRATGGSTFTSVAMSDVGGGNYQGTIPGAAVTVAGVDYYIQAVDASAGANTGRSPVGAPATVHSFTVMGASVPVITHTPIANGRPAGQAVTVQAMVTAAVPLASVRLYYRAQGGGAFTMVTMTGSGMYSGQIPGAAVAAPAVEYYVEAIDTATPPNTVSSPGAGGVHAFTVTASDTSPPTITHTPVANGRPENVGVVVSANVNDPSGLGPVTLYYRVGGGGAFASATMMGAGGNYTGTIPAGSVTRAGVDYYISAADAASPANTGTLPAGAPGVFHSFTVTRTFTVNVGDLVVSEIMNDPSGTETQREWFELYNTTQSAIDIVGFEFADDGTDSFTVTSATPVLVPAAGYLVLGRSADTALNGGVAVGYVYSGFALSNADDEIIIRAGALEVDRVAYDGGVTFPHVPGRSITLDPTTLDYASNDDGTSWCTGSSMLASGDFGTPGAPNDACQVAPDTTPPTIVHSPIGDGQQAGVAITVSAVVTDASGVAVVELFHRAATGGAYSQVAMSAQGNGNYQAVIPGAAVTVAGVQYYLRAVDSAAASNTAFEPAMGVAAPHTFQVTATDTSGPAITHAPAAGQQPAGVALSVRAAVTDPSGVAGVVLHYRSGGGAFTPVTMAPAGGSDYTADVPAAAVVEPGVEYYLEATDGATPANGSTLPLAGAGGPFSVVVVAVDLTPPTITHTPVADGRAEGQAVRIEAQVTDTSGVAEVRVYFRAAGAATFTSAALASTGGDTFAGEIPASDVMGAGVDYYLEATDASPDDNRARLPETAPADVFSFTIAGTTGEDVTPPTITHTPVTEARAPGTAVILTAQIDDPSGVVGAYVLFRVRGATDFTRLDMTEDAVSGTWSVKIASDLVVAPGIDYYLAAVDGSPRTNTGRLPQGAPAETFGFDVTGGPQPSPSPTAQPDPIDRGGGCGCVTGAGAAPQAEGILLVLGVVLLARRRRRSA